MLILFSLSLFILRVKYMRYENIQHFTSISSFDQLRRHRSHAKGTRHGAKRRSYGREPWRRARRESPELQPQSIWIWARLWQRLVVIDCKAQHSPI